MTAPDIDRVQYDGSRLHWRGPRRDLDGAFVACIGGTDTFASHIKTPYPDILEEALGVTCVNFGLPNAGIDVFRGDAALMDCVSRASACVLQVPNAINMTNLYYRVHPRRNDRVLEATDAMRALFPAVDFARFSFTRHMLTVLRTKYPGPFAYVQRELTAVWMTGMMDLLDQIDAPVVLLWLSPRSPDERFDDPGLTADPALVSRKMLEGVRPHADGLIEVPVPIDTENAGATPKAPTLTSEIHGDTALRLRPQIARILDA
ncbi:MAG: DUF6473 family protein [Pseudomonadota bacterium]